jgi:TonB family protein
MLARRIAVAVLGMLGVLTLGVDAVAQNSDKSGQPAGSASSPTSTNQGAAAPATAARGNGGGSTVQLAKLVKQVPPVYPMEADAEHISGTVVVHFTIAKDGAVTDVQVVSGPPELKEAAVAAVNQWVYEPATVSGHPVQSDANVSLVFKPPPPPPAPSVGDAAAAAAGTATAAATTPATTPATAAASGVTPALAGGAKRVQFDGKAMSKQLVHQVSPHYPDAAKEAHIGGKVVLRAIIATDGSVKELTVISGPKELQATSLKAVQQWRYKPTLINGDPVEVETTVTVIYTLG